MNTPALQSIIAEMREVAKHARRPGCDTSGIHNANMIEQWADQLSALTAQPAECVMVPTFKDFCEDMKCTPDEREELLRYLAAYRAGQTFKIGAGYSTAAPSQTEVPDNG